jgi:hypothetical protein
MKALQEYGRRCEEVKKVDNLKIIESGLVPVYEDYGGPTCQDQKENPNPQVVGLEFL